MSDNSTPHKAALYDKEVLKTIPFYRLFHSETVDLVRTIRPGVTDWLDTGCGTGTFVEYALPFFPKTRFLLADPSRPMLDRAGKRLASLPSGRVLFLSAIPTHELTVEMTGTLQVVTATQSHHYGGEDERRLATSVCRQLLEKGGVYITFENIRPATEEGTTISLERWLRFQRKAGRDPAAVEEHRSRFGRDYFPITVDEHLALLKETGFEVAELFWLSHMQAGFYAVK